MLVYPGSVDFYKICSSIVNPLTASGFIDTCQKNKVTAVIQDAAASALGKQFIRLCKHYGITLINVVWREEQVELLKKEEGAEFVLNSESPTFEADLKGLFAKV